MKEGPERIERQSMNEEETLRFFEEMGIQLYEQDSWQPGQPLLYVLQERDQRPTNDYGKPYPPHLQATVARLDSPQDVTFAKVGVVTPEKLAGSVNNERGQVDYYAIDPATRTISHVRSSFNARNYVVVNTNLFMAADHMFPKQPDQKPSASESL